ncbi:unnamed protein product [Closterium sp. NIES-54]
MPEEFVNREDERVLGQETEGQEARLLEHVTQSTPANDPQAVINAIDAYAWSSREFFMNVGDVKGVILDDGVRKANPLSAIELGGYCGYSAVRIARLLTRPGARLISVEPSELRSNVVRGMAAHAGLSDKVTVVTGTLQTSTDEIRQAASKIPFDLVFIDHWKELYMPDLLFLKEQKLIGPGTVIVADNIWIPGCPEYLEYMEKSTEFHRPLQLVPPCNSFYGPEFFMNVGDVKGAILDDAVRRANPLSAIELGAFCGYSAVRIASQLSLPGARLVSVELSESRSSVVRGMVAHAGLSDKVTVVTGTLQTSTDKIRQAASKIPFDLVFIDHVKHLYLPDLLFLKDQKLIGPGTVIVADNVVYPGSPDYLEFMERSSEFCAANASSGLAPAPIPALVASPAPPAPSPAAVAAAGTDAWSRGPAAGEATGPVLGTIAATAATGTAGATAGTGAPDPAATSMTLAAPPSTPFPSPASPSSASPSLAAAAGTPVLAAAPLLPPQPAPAKPSSSSLLTSFSPSTTFCFPAPSISPIFPLPFPMSCFPGPTISSASASPRFVSSTRFAHFTSSCISPITLASLFRTAVCLLGCRVDGAFHAFHRHQPTLPSRRDAAAAVAAAAAVTAAAATCTARGGQLVTRGTAQGAGYLVRAGQHGFRQRSSRDDEAEGAFVAGEDNTLRLRRQAR